MTLRDLTILRVHLVADPSRAPCLVIWIGCVQGLGSLSSVLSPRYPPLHTWHKRQRCTTPTTFSLCFATTMTPTASMPNRCKDSDLATMRVTLMKPKSEQEEMLVFWVRYISLKCIPSHGNTQSGVMNDSILHK